MTKQRHFIFFLLIALIILFSTSCNRKNIKAGIIIGDGMELSLDKAAAKVVGNRDHGFGVPMKAIKLDDGTKIVAICYEQWCSDVKIGQKVESAPIKGSYQWRIVRIIDSSTNINLTDKKIVPLQHNMLDGCGKVIEDHGFSCNGVKYGEYHDKAIYTQIDYSGPIEYCITCNNGLSYKLLQSKDNSFQVIPCNDVDCEICEQKSGTMTQTTTPPEIDIINEDIPEQLRKEIFIFYRTAYVIADWAIKDDKPYAPKSSVSFATTSLLNAYKFNFSLARVTTFLYDILKEGEDKNWIENINMIYAGNCKIIYKSAADESRMPTLQEIKQLVLNEFKK